MALRTVCKVSRIFRDTIHLPCFTISCFTSSMLRADCYSAMKVWLNARESVGLGNLRSARAPNSTEPKLVYDAALASASESATG